MNQADGPRFDSALIALAAVTGKTLDMGIKAAYFVALEEIPFETVNAAMRAAMKTCEFFPSAAEIRKLCDEAEAEQERFALQAQNAVALLPDPDAQYRGQTHEAPEQTYHCLTCKDSGFVYFQKIINGQPSRWVRKCSCVLEGDETMINPVVRARIRRAQDALGIRKKKYAKKRPKREDD